ncbi:FAD:protein FMN transferase [Phenylobacterium deserti]|uniref:FAD:protein FMN transferase n=1 Tax=Phenylobacterium deserti TaxID=1914756 RepID=A0A328AS19_9CAUL|nr:FAD:protein FMN transferase [Phenylobacterium deserti]RAK57349.1 FAD:protein FMN transferase [Phenylobacterium deserti]
MRIAVPLDIDPQAVRPPAGVLHTLSGPTMGVAWSARFFAPPALDDARVSRALQGVVDEIVAQMSPWEAASDISRFNRAPAGQAIALPALFWEVLERACAFAEASGGAFDPTAGRLVDLWGFGPPGPIAAAPDPAVLAEAQGAIGWTRLRLDPAGRKAVQPGGVALDLSGIAKGYGVDQLARALERLGVQDYLVEIGGELRGAGVKPTGEPWWVDLEDPPDLAVLAQGPVRVALHNLAIATSGDWRRFRENAGRRLAHTLDPRSGRPVENDLAAVTVLHESCMDADALCTVLMVLGPDAGLAFAESRGVAARMVVREGGRAVERLTPAFAAMLD